IDHPVCLDALRIRQVLTNLLHNAVKFTPPDGRIRLVASIEDQALRTEVCDTGRGFTEAEREALFVPFSQLKDTPAGGTGLGLAITRAIVEAHGGHVEASSPGLGQGACFRFTLPL
ncbi:MAG TPA: ATP-binding protein, partial [Oscillatoriaceae cyanobacterium]